MLKQLTALEVKIEDRIYQLVCDPNSPLGEVHDVLSKMKAHVIDKIKSVQESEKPNEEKKNG